MASQYSLKLKAQLDSSEIQAELNRLRSEQLNLNSSSGSSSAPSTNLQTNINNSVVRLNNTMTQMKSSIDRLNTSISRLVGSTFSSSSSSSSKGGYLPGGFSSSDQMYEYTDKLIKLRKDLRGYQSSMPSYKEYYLKIVDEANKRAAEQGMKVAPIDDADLKEQWKMHRKFTQEQISETRQKIKEITTNNKLQSAKQMRQMMKGTRFLMGAQAFGGLEEDIGQSYGRTAGIVAGGLTEGIGTGAMAAMALGGPAGWAMGIGTAVNSITKSLVEGAKVIQRGSEEAAKILSSGKRRISEHRETAKDMMWLDTLDGLSDRDINKQLSSTQEKLKAAKQNYYTLSNSDDALKSAAEKYLIESGTTKAGSEERIAIERKYGEAVVAYAKSLDAAKKEVDKLTQKEAILSRVAESRAQAEMKIKTEEERLKAEEERLKAEEERMRLEKDREEKRIRAERELKLTQLNESAVGIIRGWEAQDEVKNVQNKLNQIMFPGGNTSSNPRRQFELSKRMLKDYRTLLDEASRKSFTLAKNAQTMSSVEGKEAALKDSEYYSNEASRLQNIVGMIESFIGGISQIRNAPDLKNVTSIGQYGFGMGEVNDNMSRMQRYYDTMEDLTRDIRNTLNDGVKTTTTYN